MKKYLSLFLVTIAFVQCALMDALEKSDVARFKSLSHRVNELPDISDKYYCIQLASELKEKQETISCDLEKEGEMEMERELYSYQVLKAGKCKPSVPESAKRAIETMQSLVDVDFALQFPKMQYDANKIAEAAFTRLSQCSTLSCNTLSFSEKVAAINILSRLHDSLNTSTKSLIKPFTGYAKALLSSAVSKDSVTDEAFLAFSDLTLFVATHTTLSAVDAQTLAARFLSLHTTSRPDVAFALLRVLSVLRPALGDTAVSLRGDYVDGKVRVAVTDVLAQPRSDVIVVMREGTEEPLRLAFEKDAFVAPAALSQGVHSFVVKVQNMDRELLASTKMDILSPVTMRVVDFTTTLNGETKTHSLEEKTELELKAKSFLSILVRADMPESFVPATALLQLTNSKGKKATLMMARDEKGFRIEIAPSKKDVAGPFNYEGGRFAVEFLCGDSQMRDVLKVHLMEVTMEFVRPKEPWFPLYSKPLMYATEQSLGPMKEIEHVFRPENKNPFFLFPVLFSLSIVAALVILIMVWRRIGLTMKRESTMKQTMRFAFVGCIAAIVFLYAQFWFAGNMVSLMKRLLPVVLVTLIVGNRAL